VKGSEAPRYGELDSTRGGSAEQPEDKKDGGDEEGDEDVRDDDKREDDERDETVRSRIWKRGRGRLS